MRVYLVQQLNENYSEKTVEYLLDFVECVAPAESQFTGIGLGENECQALTAAIRIYNPNGDFQSLLDNPEKHRVTAKNGPTDFGASIYEVPHIFRTSDGNTVFLIAPC